LRAIALLKKPGHAAGFLLPARKGSPSASRFSIGSFAGANAYTEQLAPPCAQTSPERGLGAHAHPCCSDRSSAFVPECASGANVFNWPTAALLCGTRLEGGHPGLPDTLGQGVWRATARFASVSGQVWADTASSADSKARVVQSERNGFAARFARQNRGWHGGCNLHGKGPRARLVNHGDLP
jgi:hypothetical protein